MVRYSILNLAAIATLLLGAEAGPCRPATTVATSIVVATSTLAADTSATSIDTTTVTTPADTTTTVPGDTTTTVLADTTTTDGVESTTKTLADTATTTQAESTTTTAAAACAETQLFINPGFDDSPSGIAPWTSNANLIQSQAQSGTNALSAVFSNGQPDYYFKQTLQNLNGDYEFSYYYRVVSVSPGADYVCNIELKVGDTSKFGAMYDSAGGWRSDSVSFSIAGGAIAQADVQLILTCYGEFVRIEVNIDTLAFTRVCSA
ncbi:hypothetical protein BFJ63_vAg11107 [Fusarium oxysporum f. sp. narcissi]|uniref:CBM-cenC domain-containing protein n=3 Tax=Fusarium oxysporum TaxID=5507 RepID=A0A4Q2VEI3_FUSOX|nr:hypothetical protein FOVG_12802 [Fusarium oxysporum f. sp. pisi HDV247]RKK08975.1 hypothetical protein BFJ65_g16634 [Fusarium oxysporum f. sp. cepae]RKK98419.1 hypothetical protein BFJ71_g6772 [Fusarium oxysporum]RYC86081.1 hypothetical protein BFJ63_vAg11107 [Fusarium oxysporum f. sp. narcissi]WKT51761.1 hypothetical protein QSH57_002275 [Fusarium oxysporum f. sp. vasinfectum]